MLVLSRQLDESIMIGDNIVVRIVDVRGDKVRLGISAPPSVPIHRQEIFNNLQPEEAARQAARLKRGAEPPRRRAA